MRWSSWLAFRTVNSLARTTIKYTSTPLSICTSNKFDVHKPKSDFNNVRRRTAAETALNLELQPARRSLHDISLAFHTSHYHTASSIHLRTTRTAISVLVGIWTVAVAGIELLEHRLVSTLTILWRTATLCLRTHLPLGNAVATSLVCCEYDVAPCSTISIARHTYAMVFLHLGLRSSAVWLRASSGVWIFWKLQFSTG